MKAQKLGLVLGMNMAVACLVLQGCKAVRPGAGNLPPPEVDPKVMPADPVPAQTTTTTTTVTVVTPEPAPAPVSQPVVIAPQPSTVPAVKPLPPPPPKPVVNPVKPLPPKPVVSPVAPVAAAGDGIVYVVKPGDQLFAVSRRYNVKMSAIERANPGLNPNKIRAGQKIKIPGVKAAQSADAAVAKIEPAAEKTAAPVTAANTVAPLKTKNAFKSYTGPTKEYKVLNGDSLGKIAHESGISIRALKELNKMTKDSLRVGQTILIPAEKVVAVAPVQDKADSAVAKADEKKPVENKAVEKKPVEKKETAPAVKPAAPAVAPAVPAVAPAAKPVEPPAPAVKPDEAKPAVEPPAIVVDDKEPATPASSATYTVKEGDDLVSVAIAWGISPSQLMDLNDFKAGDSIKPGQVLKLPANAKQQNAQ